MRASKVVTVNRQQPSNTTTSRSWQLVCIVHIGVLWSPDYKKSTMGVFCAVVLSYTYRETTLIPIRAADISTDKYSYRC